MSQILRQLQKMEITYQVEFYNLDVIISVGYRVKSKQGIQFRQWAAQRLKDFLIRLHHKRKTISSKRTRSKSAYKRNSNISQKLLNRNK